MSVDELTLEQDRKAVEAKARSFLEPLSWLFSGWNFCTRVIVLGDYHHAEIQVRNDFPVEVQALPAQRTEGSNIDFIRVKFPITMGFRAATPSAQSALNAIYIEKGLLNHVREYSLNPQMSKVQTRELA